MTVKEEVSMSDLERLRPFWHVFSSAQLGEMQALSEYTAERVAGKRLISDAGDDGEQRKSKAKKKKKTSEEPDSELQ